MFCKNCGNLINDGASMCSVCGAPVTQSQTQQQPFVQTPNSQQQQPFNQPYGYNTPNTQPMTVGGYILRSLINFIPVVGPLVYFIMLFIWGGDATKELSFRNWAKAQLWMMLISVGVVLVIWIIVLVAGVSAYTLGNTSYNYYY